MNASPRKRWTKTEKWLLVSPLLVGLFAAAMSFGPQTVRKKLGYPIVLSTGADNLLYYIALSENGSTVAAAAYNPKNSLASGEIWLWDARTLERRAVWPSAARRIPGRTGMQNTWTTALSLSPDSQTLVAMHDNAPLTAYDVATRRTKWRYNTTGYINVSHFVKNGKKVGYTEPAGNGVNYVILDANTGKVLTHWKVAPLYSDEVNFAFAPDGRTMACIGPRLLPTSQQNALRAPANKLSSLDATEGRNIEIRRVSDGKLLRTILNPWTHSVNFSPDGLALVAVSEAYRPPEPGHSLGQTARCFSAQTGALLWQLKQPKKPVYVGSIKVATYSPAGNAIALHRVDSVDILDAYTGEWRRRLHWSGDPDLIINANAAAFSPDGRRFFARGYHDVLVWDLD